MEFNPKARALALRVTEIGSSLRINQHLHVNALVTLIFFCMASLVADKQTVRAFAWFFIFFWAWAVGYDLIALYKKIAKKPLGKVFFLLLLSLATNFAIMLGSHVVNDVVGIDPTKFPHAIALLSILSIPVFVAAGLTLIWVVLLLTAPILLMFHMFPDEVKKVVIPGYTPPENYPFRKTTFLIQFFSIAIFASFAQNMIERFAKNYDEEMNHVASEFIFQLEMYPRAQCAIPKGTHAAFVADEKILTATRAASGNAITFDQPRDCKAGS